MKTYQKIIAGGLVLAAGLIGCNRNDQDLEKRITESQLPHSQIEAEAFNVGRTARLNMSSGDEGDNAGITRAVLYENGEPIREWDGRPFYSTPVEITKSEPGKHTYQLEVTDRDRNTVKSDIVAIEYSGILTDKLPHSQIEAEAFNVGRTARLNMSSGDEGDNAGITRAVLYENGEPIREWDGRPFYSTPVEITKSEPGKHTYQLEVTDKGGHKVKSEPVVIAYKF